MNNEILSPDSVGVQGLTEAKLNICLGIDKEQIIYVEPRMTSSSPYLLMLTIKRLRDEIYSLNIVSDAQLSFSDVKFQGRKLVFSLRASSTGMNPKLNLKSYLNGGQLNVQRVEEDINNGRLCGGNIIRN